MGNRCESGWTWSGIQPSPSPQLLTSLVLSHSKHAAALGVTWSPVSQLYHPHNEPRDKYSGLKKLVLRPSGGARDPVRPQGAAPKKV